MTIAIIRIRGQVNVKRDIAETMHRLRLRRKYACVVVNESKEMRGMIKKVNNHVTLGEIDDETLKLLVEKRGRKIGDKLVKKEEVEKIVAEIKEGNIKTIKPFFRLHPPIKGFRDIKQHFPIGELGNRKEKINELIKRMI
jgi:large subunit ribosomal protein L30